MSLRPPIVLVLAVLGSASVTYAALLFFASIGPDFADDRNLSAALGTVLGAVSFLAAVTVSLTGRRRASGSAASAPSPPPTPPPPPSEVVVIKRTEMNWQPLPKSMSPEQRLQERLDDVNGRMGRVKVQFGLGHVSKDTYKKLMEDLEREKTEIELSLHRRSVE